LVYFLSCERTDGVRKNDVGKEGVTYERAKNEHKLAKYKTTKERKKEIKKKKN